MVRTREHSARSTSMPLAGKEECPVSSRKLRPGADNGQETDQQQGTKRDLEGAEDDALAAAASGSRLSADR